MLESVVQPGIAHLVDVGACSERIGRGFRQHVGACSERIGRGFRQRCRLLPVRFVFWEGTLPVGKELRWRLNSGIRQSSSSVVVRALEKDRSGRDGESVDDWDSEFEIEVPSDQRPANELAALKESVLYSWAQLSPLDFALRLGGLWVLFFLLLGGPISAASFEPSREPLKFVVAAGAGALFPVALLVLRMYLGWSYVGNRLLSAVVPYEETGWYDGQLWVKPPEVLARDRLLGAYQVKPIMNRLKQTLIGAAALLATATVALVALLPPQEDASVFAPRRANSEAMAAEGKPGFRAKDLLSLPVEVADDDELAAAAAAAAKGRPVYCSDRFYRALAGGQYCKWEDLMK